MRLEEIVDRALQDATGDARAGDVFLSEHHAWPRYAIGRNPETIAIHRVAPLDGIIDDYCQKGDHWQGIPLLSTDEARKQARVVNCSTSIRPVATQEHLRDAGFSIVVGIGDVVCAGAGSLPWPTFVSAQRREMAENLAAWQTIHDNLEDETSRRTLVDVLRFRLSANPDCMKGYAVRMDQQYFEIFMDYHREVFVDGGGFDGDTAEAFATLYPDYRKILLFEPSASNMSAARIRLSSYRDITYFSAGLSDAPGRLRFETDAGSASAISDEGTEEILVERLDALVQEPVSFIKMDLEGWELPALRGATRHLRDDQPKLALAIYHDASDLRKIYTFIQEFGHRYRIFLRHYTQGWSETILYFRM